MTDLGRFNFTPVDPVTTALRRHTASIGENETAIGENETAIALNTPKVTITNENVAVGLTALDAVTSGNQNTAIGHDALTSLTGASGSVAVGEDALKLNDAGYCTAVGRKSLDVCTGGNNTAIGVLSGSGGGPGNAITSGTYNVCVGYQASPPIATGSTQLTIGSGNTVWIQGDSHSSQGWLSIGANAPISRLSVDGMISLTSEESGAPAQPIATKGFIYSKTDGKLYWRSYLIGETNITGAGGAATTYTSSWVDSGANALLRLTAGGGGSGTQDITLVAGSNVTLTPSGGNLTIASTDTNTNTYHFSGNSISTTVYRSGWTNIAGGNYNYGKLTVMGTGGGYSYGAHLWIANWGLNAVSSGGSTGHAIFCEGMLSSQTIRISSDERLKCNFVDLNDYESLQQLRQLKPYKYNYIDQARRGSVTVTGFKAQDVMPIIEGSVSLSRDCLPDIYKKCPIISYSPFIVDIETSYGLTVGNTLRLYEYENPEDASLFQLHTHQFKITNINGTQVTLDGSLNDVSPPATTMVSDAIEAGYIFVVGREHDDMHTLDYNRIIPVIVAGIQEIDRKQTSIEADIAAIKAHLGL